MKIVSIEPTPSPNSMKINLNESLAAGDTRQYKQGSDLADAPDYIQQLMEVPGVKEIYHVMDFIALERNARFAWEDILPGARAAFGQETNETSNSKDAVDDDFGEVKVFIQMFRGIPMQVKLLDGEEEHRFGLPDRFMKAAMDASSASDNMVMEREWKEQNPRYGSPEEVGVEVTEEVSATYDEKRLGALVKDAFNPGQPDSRKQEKKHVTLEMLDHPEWKERYAALDRLDPEITDLPLLEKALQDEKASIRRLAAVYLGMIESKDVLPLLYKALKDKSVTVRRTAGDCMSDLGYVEAIPEMVEALSDKNKLVRWRAAMFLYEVGDESAVPALEQATEDPEFEVKMQARMALERIKGGEEAKGSVWHQMTQARKSK
ncbi:conserved virulence factor C family protein [Alkalihalobacillus sp. CinArs1]|uniref:conserved virulence factor C family protein n=1 Tax=Alkalihalobacillus sp. CinArs1 TaxID=2995314 RepID=UPI0022DCFDFD|nr:conserved virulence factor C family protein [Alkalihalobacillus sp. CinArs1]